jgi:hypothetical protein
MKCDYQGTTNEELISPANWFLINVLVILGGCISLLDMMPLLIESIICRGILADGSSLQ